MSHNQDEAINVLNSKRIKKHQVILSDVY